MFRSIEDFAADWAGERASTTKVLRALRDDALPQPVVPGGRTAGSLAWHIVQTLPEMLGHAGLSVAGPGQDERQPGAAAEIASAYESAAADLERAVRDGWTDDMLGEEVSMYGQRWTRATVLSVLIRHEAHHRGQLTVLMRQAGLAVPGCYGPSREEWQAMGMPPLP